MNILIVPSWYKTRNNTVLGSFFREQALSLKNQGHTVYVADATFQGRAALNNPWLFRLKKYDDEGMMTYVLSIPTFGMARLPSGGISIYRHNLERIYKQLLKDGVNIDVIHAHSFYPAGAGAVWLGKKYGVPTVVTEHNSIVLKKTLSPKRIEMLSATVEGSSAFACVSNALRRSVVELTNTKKNIIVLPNAVGNEFSTEKKTKSECFTFASIGNLISGKRFDLTLKAFARLYSDNKEVRLKIAGDGVLRQELENMAETLGVASAVEFFGRVPRNDVPTLLGGCDAFVLPSDAETFGVVYIEALASGLPVIATKNGGAEEIITDENGILIEKGDEDALYVAMKRIVDEKEQFDPSKLEKDCKEKYGEEFLAKKTLELYRTILQSKG